MIFHEDLQPGQRFGTPEHEMTAAEIVAFARQYDPQSFHLDEAKAQQSLFGRLVASGWHTAATSMRLMVQGSMELEGGVIGAGVENLRWPQPVVPGDRLHVEMEVLEKPEKPSRTGRGRVRLLCQTKNQRGEVVQEMTANLLVPKKSS
jgi:acyl dehydratase